MGKPIISRKAGGTGKSRRWIILVKMFNTPILFLIFNRPQTTLLVFEQIKKVQPKWLFIAADGPHIEKPGEEELCNETREIVLKGIDWDCEVKTLFRSENVGCMKGPSEAINWFFGNVEQGIILEDDCLPDSSFFTYCEQLLEEYKYNEKIITIGGTNLNTTHSTKIRNLMFKNESFIFDKKEKNSLVNLL